MKTKLSVVCLPGLLALLLSAGCVFGKKNKDGSTALERGHQAYLTGNYAEAEQSFKSTRKTEGNSPRGQEAACREAYSLLAQGKPKPAEKRFSKVIDGKPERKIWAQALLGRAKARTSLEDYDAAEKDFALLKREFRPETDGAEVLAAWADCRQRRGDSGGASDLRRQLLREYPGNIYQRVASTRAAARYAVQLTRTFDNLAAAQVTMEKIKAAGFDSFVAKRKEGDRNVYSIQVGAFASHDAASRMVDKLKARGYSAEVH